MRVLFPVMFFLYGLLIGSFLNVCVYRLPLGKKVSDGRSHCPSCDHVLIPADLVPVLSYLLLKRRCRYCKRPVSGRYAVIELATAAAFAAIAWLFQPTGFDRAFLNAASLAVFTSVLLVWAMIRFDRYLPPNSLYIWLFVPAVGMVVLQGEPLFALLSLLIVAAANVLLLFVRLWRPNIEKSGHELLGFSAIALVLSWPGVLGFVLIELFALIGLRMWHQRNRTSPTRTGMVQSPTRTKNVLSLFLAVIGLILIGLKLSQVI